MFTQYKILPLEAGNPSHFKAMSKDEKQIYFPKKLHHEVH